jgi:hypothetical protein
MPMDISAIGSGKRALGEAGCSLGSQACIAAVVGKERSNIRATYSNRHDVGARGWACSTSWLVDSW